MDGRTCQMGWDSAEWQKHAVSGEWLLFYSSNSSTHYDTPSGQGVITDRRVEELAGVVAATGPPPYHFSRCKHRQRRQIEILLLFYLSTFRPIMIPAATRI